jgi:hypothetical protein
VALAEKANARVSNKTTIDLSMKFFIVNSFPMLSYVSVCKKTGKLKERILQAQRPIKEK